MHVPLLNRQVTRPTVTRTRRAPIPALQRDPVSLDLPFQRALGNRAYGELQAKLKVGSPNDRYEQEAERVSEQVMSMPDLDVQPHPQAEYAVHQRTDPGETIQRLAAHRNPSLTDATIIDEEEVEADAVQTLRSPVKESGGATVSKRLLNRSQGGVSLAPSAKRFMEARFGAEFGGVRIHADGRAAALSSALGARAFTHGRDIFFAEREYQPDSLEGRRVLAHELTHVVQQGASQSRLPLQQHAAQHGNTNAPAVIQRLSSLRRVVSHNVAPWGAGGPVGSNHEVETDTGSTVSAWQGYLPLREQYRYWCHGHSLGSYVAHDYSVYSGPPMATAIADEWRSIRPQQTKPGDIAVWTAGFDHSAKFTRPVIENGQLVPDRSELSTKNGQAPLTHMSITDLAAIYGGQGIAVFRRK
jgi:hypothetical protein